jgi:glucosamine-phosphate N-acetyltransferase
MDLKIDKCKFRKLNEMDYNNYIVMINEFRNTTFTYEQYIETLKYMNNFSEIWVVEYESDIIATGTIIYEKKFIYNNGYLGHIEDICVKNNYRKNGIGKILIKYLMNIAKEKGCYKVTLDCNQENVDFYIKCGLEKRGFQMSQLTTNF